MSQSTAVGDSLVALSVDTSDRNDVLSFYHCIYAASENYAANIGWDGNVGSCTPGTTSPAFKDDVRRRINYYRAMAGLPADIEFEATRNAKAQAAALIMSDRNGLSHDPAATWGTGRCWTADGQEGAEKGNLALGSFGAGSIDGYMRDPGNGNEAVGHRRWLLYPRQTVMGTGDIPSGGQTPTNSIWVVDSSTHRSATGSYYAWPPAGFVPSSTVWPRWSLHFSTATFGSPTFTSAAVTMKRVSDNANVPVSIIHRYTGGGLAADPAIVWEPDWSGFGGSAPEETEFEVSVTGVTPGASGASATFTYRVTPINVNALAEPYAITGTSSPPTTGATYEITPLSGAGADKYEVEVASTDATPWTEGAEDSPTPVIIDGTTGGYDLREALTPAGGSPGPRTGTKAFHFTFDNFEDQSFEIDRDIIPTATSTLDFWNIFRASVPSINRLSAEISTDAGGSWTEIWGRQAGGSSSGSWDSSWQGASLSLAAYDGQIIRIRFIYRRNGGSAFNQTGQFYGCYLDDITVTNSSSLGAGTITDLGVATSFTLDDTTAGGPLTEGTTYFLRARPTLGCKAYGWSDPLLATAVAPTGYDAWVHRATVGASHLDHDQDGLTNGFEYGFGLDPTDPSDAGSLPAPTMPADNQLELTMTEPAGVSGVTYGAEWTINLVDWFPMTDSGSGTTHTFLATSPASHLFVRWTVVVE
ncbi:MAG: CAP domain-containing protein [Akkermansiaceae bacterium]|nr:CAP domain-containing protein [Akkermansiaceae bacterium]